METGEQQPQTRSDDKQTPTASQDAQYRRGDAPTTAHTDAEFGDPGEYTDTPAADPVGYTQTAQQDAGRDVPGPDMVATYLDVVGQHDLLHARASTNGVDADLLIDGGSTHDLMSLDFATRAGIPLLKACGQVSITLADGSTISTPRQKTRHSVSYSIGSFSDSRRFLIAPITHDIVLGKPWLTRHNPNIDWETNTIVLGDGSKIVANEHRKGLITIENLSATV